MSEIRKLVVDEEHAGARLDAFVSASFSDLTRSYLAKMIEEGALCKNGQVCTKTSTRVKAGEELTLTIPEAAPIETVAQAMDIKLVYEDDDLAVVYKPRGLVVHPAAGHEDGTLVNGLLYQFGDSLSGINGEKRPGIVHRIDKDTSGLLLVCKTDRAHQLMSEKIKNHDFTRIYHAVVCGVVKDDKGTVNAPLGRSKTDRKKQCIRWDGRDAITHYEVLERFVHFTYVACRLETGRTHQIRVHMKSIGHPILGDPLYGWNGKDLPEVKRIKALDAEALEGQILHACTLGFEHPITGEYLEFTEEDPPYFRLVLEELRK